MVKLLQTMFEDATQVRASDIHIEPQEAQLQIRFRIDGVLHVQTEADSKIAPALVLRLKLMSGLDISEKRLPQDGRFNVKVRNSAIDVRISTMPTQYGESVVMRLLNQSGGLLALDKLGMPPDMLERFREVIQRPQRHGAGHRPDRQRQDHHAVCRAGRAQHRRAQDHHRRGPGGIPPARHQPGAGERKDRPDFRRVLRSALRQDPDVILVGEMRDAETAEIGLRAAMTGHLVFSTLHTNDAVSTPIRLLDMGVPRYMVALSLQLVLAQRLVRVICESCSEPYTAAAAASTNGCAASWATASTGFSYKHGRGCSHCNGTGYRGRTGVYEMLEMTQAAGRSGQPATTPAQFIAGRARADGGQHAAPRTRLQLVADGTHHGRRGDAHQQPARGLGRAGDASFSPTRAATARGELVQGVLEGADSGAVADQLFDARHHAAGDHGAGAAAPRAAAACRWTLRLEAQGHARSTSCCSAARCTRC